MKRKMEQRQFRELRAIRHVLWLVLAGVLLLVGLQTTPFGNTEAAEVIGGVALMAAVLIVVFVCISKLVGDARWKDLETEGSEEAGDQGPEE